MPYADPTSEVARASARASVKRHYDSNKQYYADKAARARIVLREFVRELKHMKPCTDCGLPYPFYVMHWDHLRDKVDQIDRIIQKTGSKRRVLEEIAKCELVCANCHAARTWNRMQEASQASMVQGT